DEADRGRHRAEQIFAFPRSRVPHRRGVRRRDRRGVPVAEDDRRNQMKAAVQTAYGGPEVVVIRDIAKPLPKDNEVLVRIAATTVTSGDARLRAFRVPAAFWLPARLFLGIIRPRKAVLGSEFAGEVEAVGPGVRRFKAGD